MISYQPHAPKQIQMYTQTVGSINCIQVYRFVKSVARSEGGGLELLFGRKADPNLKVTGGGIVNFIIIIVRGGIQQ